MPSRVSIAGLWTPVQEDDAVNEVDGAEATADTGKEHGGQSMDGIRCGDASGASVKVKVQGEKVTVRMRGEDGRMAGWGEDGDDEERNSLPTSCSTHLSAFTFAGCPSSRSLFAPPSRNSGSGSPSAGSRLTDKTGG